MTAAAAGTLQVRSTRVLLDGAYVPATVDVAVHDDKPPVVVAVSRRIDDVLSVAVRDLGDALIVPAPLDLHLHGCGGHAVPPGGSSDEVAAAIANATQRAEWCADALPATAYEWIATLPVPATDPTDPVAHHAQAAAELTRTRGTPGQAFAPCVGLRIEGLFLNPTRAGIWPATTFRPLDTGILEELATACADAGTPITIIDVAPEIATPTQTASFIARSRELGIRVSLAHTDATCEQAQHAIDAGATLATHLWNAMRPVTHRDPGVVAACIADDRVTSELICDGAHLHPGTIAMTARAVGSGRWAVISDASPFAGCAPGRYEWAGTTVVHDGATLRDDAGTLAGSASLSWDAHTTLRAAGIDDGTAAIALGATPRRVLNPDRPLGLVPGDPVWVCAAI